MLIIHLPASPTEVSSQSLGGSFIHCSSPAFFLAAGLQAVAEPSKPCTSTLAQSFHFIPLEPQVLALPAQGPIIFEWIRNHGGDPLVQLSLKLVARPL